MDCADPRFSDLAGVLLAAGRGRRFGGNKLEAMFEGKMLGMHAAATLARVGCGWLFAVHDPAHAGLAAALDAQGFALIANDDADRDLSHSLALAIGAARATEATALLVCLGDMPFVTAAHLCAVIAAGKDRVVASALGDTRMPPALLPRSCWPALATQTGDIGARTLSGDATLVRASAALLADIDTQADLARRQ